MLKQRFRFRRFDVEQVFKIIILFTSWRPRHWNLLENAYTSLIKAHMCQRPHSKTFWKDHSSVWLPTNQYLVCALQLTSQIAPTASIFSPLRCALTHFPCQLPVSRFIGWLGVSLISLSLAHTLTSPFQSLLIYSISRADAYLFTPWKHSLCQKRLEDIAGDYRCIVQ